MPSVTFCKVAVVRSWLSVEGRGKKTQKDGGTKKFCFIDKGRAEKRRKNLFESEAEKKGVASVDVYVTPVKLYPWHFRSADPTPDSHVTATSQAGDAGFNTSSTYECSYNQRNYLVFRKSVLMAHVLITRFLYDVLISRVLISRVDCI